MLGIGLDIFITLLVYLIFPVCYVLANGKIEKKQATKIALWNSVVCCIIFCIIRAIITDGQVVFSSLAPAVFYFFINRWILTNKTISQKDEEKKNGEVLEDSNMASVETEEKTSDNQINQK